MQQLPDTSRPTPPFDPAEHGWEYWQLTPFTTLAGPIWRKREGNSFVCGLLVERRHCNTLGILHSGTLLTFADHSVGIASAYALPDHPIVTLQLSTQFVAPAHEGEFLTGQSHVVRATRSVLFVRGTINVGERIIATSDGIWKIVRPFHGAYAPPRVPG